MAEFHRSRLESLKGHYDRISHPACSWEEVRRRLLNEEQQYLTRIVRMKIRGVFFGFDLNGDPLVADGGVEPAMLGENYGLSRLATFDEGYEMFNDEGELEMFENFSGIRHSEGSFATWLESGMEPEKVYVDWMKGKVPMARIAGGVPVQVSNENPSFVSDTFPAKFASPYLGTRRLLRIKDF